MSQLLERLARVCSTGETRTPNPFIIRIYVSTNDLSLIGVNNTPCPVVRGLLLWPHKISGFGRQHPRSHMCLEVQEATRQIFPLDPTLPTRGLAKKSERRPPTSTFLTPVKQKKVHLNARAEDRVRRCGTPCLIMVENCVRCKKQHLKVLHPQPLPAIIAPKNSVPLYSATEGSEKEPFRSVFFVWSVVAV